ncbi:MAG: hypothetical protein JO253_07970 [Alphaproteobacteria bacterium]|nr:hypothetical protein [Alphaproteobacteria bacterium]
MAYTVAKGFTLEELIADVDRLGALGWSKVGGMGSVAVSAEELVILVNVVEVRYKLLFFQAMEK